MSENVAVDEERYCTGPIAGWSRRPDDVAGGEWIRIDFEAGGAVEVFTTCHLLWHAYRDPKKVM